MSRRKKDLELVDNIAYHAHTTDIKTNTILGLQTVSTSVPPEASIATNIIPLSPNSAPRPSGESGDIATEANVAYGASHSYSHTTTNGPRTVTTNVPPQAPAASIVPISPSSVPQPPGESGDITTAANVAYEPSDIATSVNPAYQPLQNSSGNTVEYDYA